MQMGTSPLQESAVKTAIRPGGAVREPDRQILQELEAKIAAKMAEREANWLRGLCPLCVYQQGSDVDNL